MRLINIIQASKLALKGEPDVTPNEEDGGRIIGKNLYYETGIDVDGQEFWYSGDIFLVDDEMEL